MNHIRPHRLKCIQLQQQVPYKFQVNWELITPPATVLQPSAQGIPGPIIAVKDRGEEGIRCLCFIFISICEVSNLIK